MGNCVAAPLTGTAMSLNFNISIWSNLCRGHYSYTRQLIERWGTMEAYDDLVQYARDCMRYAQTATCKEVAEELERVAREYQERAAQLDGGKLPDIHG
jgi:hypothetical protein